MTIETRYALGERVRIRPIEQVEGRIIQVLQDWMGVSYKVRYFHGGEERVTFVFEDELEAIA